MSGEINILVVEDDRSLRRSIAATLKVAGYRSLEAATLADAHRAHAHHKPRLILLDLGLPDGDGVEFIAQLRAKSLTPILVLSARGSEPIKVAALDAGADDYVTKPFGVDELLARIRAGLRHGVQAKGVDPIVRTGDLEIDLAARILRRNRAEIDLSPKEFELLAALCEKLGKVARHADLLKTVWGSEQADIQYLRVYISQLRAKLEPNPATPIYIVADPGVGYRLVSLSNTA
jgi:two-component system, OmpR family, KDP operon response regulator KdpE